RHLVPEAAEAELRAQIEHCLAAGMRPTHIDAHMGAAMLAELLPAHVSLAREYELLPVLPRSITWPPDLDAYRATVAALDAAGSPVIDHCRGTLPMPRNELALGWQHLIGVLADGITHFALHATIPGEIEAIAPDHAEWRTAEYALFASGHVAKQLAAAGIAVSGYRNLATAWRTPPPG
ncbi:MAG: ChbG/HpnK family deacetylase, partial [Rhodospirillales bacterium]|nr:ChbG/HpnK family deacetylase [Rhodospirillales bacterium]